MLVERQLSSSDYFSKHGRNEQRGRKLASQSPQCGSSGRIIVIFLQHIQYKVACIQTEIQIQKGLITPPEAILLWSWRARKIMNT